MNRPARPTTAPPPQRQAGGSAPIAAPVAAAIARDPRVRAALSGHDAGHRDHVRRAIAAAIEKKLGGRGGPR
jgi:hypothetical protein